MTDFETRPLSSFNWHAMNGHSNDAGPSGHSTRNRSSSSFSSSNSRRRSAVTSPPSGPPPDLPVPSLPSVSEQLTPFVDYGLEEDEIQSYARDDDYHLSDARLNPFQRPTASSQLTAVTQFSQSRLASNPVAPHDVNLSDSPPRSLLPRNVSPVPQTSPPSHPPPPPPSNETAPDRNLLAPPENGERASTKKPSSRRALTRALELAKEAVRLDSTNDDPYGAIQAYGQSVTLLKEVMERVRRGEDSTEHRSKNGRRRSVVAQEEEVRRLKTIHDTYADRMSILSLIYSIPASVPGSGRESPTQFGAEPTTPLEQDATEGENAPQQHLGIEESYLSISPANSPPLTTAGRMPTSLMNEVRNPVPQETAHTSMRISRQVPPTSRMRSSSNLPPRPPAPSNSPPSTPPISGTSRVPSDLNPPSPRLLIPSEDGRRSRANSVGHGRTGSGSRLEVLREEAAPLTHTTQHQHQHGNDRDLDYRQPSANTIRQSPPLPALPSPNHSESEFNSTPRGPINDETQQSVEDAPPSAYYAPRSRGGSTLSDPTGSRTAKQQLISDSTTNGTIWQRREKNKSTISAQSEDVVGGSLVEPSLSKRFTNNALAQATGRNRSSSFPVRPSNAIPGLPADFGLKHPYQSAHSGPTSSNANSTPTSQTSQSRRTPSSVRQSPQPSSRALHSSFVPPVPLPALSLVPAPPVLPGQLPTTPTSPLPPVAPNDALRKPYHLMNLLNLTMTSKSGGYITRKLHVPYDVWSQGGAKLTNLPEKIRVLAVLCEAMQELQNASVDFAGPMGVASGMGMGVGSITKKDGEVWVSKVEEFLLVCDTIVANFSKKLSVGEGFVVKKSSGVTSWTGKLARQMDKFTNGKNLDSPTLYVQNLQRLFTVAQLLDEHTMALNAQPMSPVYAALPTEIRMALEPKLRRCSEFFATVVLTFVIRDLSQLLDKYAKKGEKWLAE